MVFLNIRDHRFLHERDSLARISWHSLSKMNVAHRLPVSRLIAFPSLPELNSTCVEEEQQKKAKVVRSSLTRSTCSLRVFRVEPGLLRIIGCSLSNLCIQKKKKKRRMYVLRRTTHGGMNAHDEEL